MISEMMNMMQKNSLSLSELHLINVLMWNLIITQNPISNDSLHLESGQARSFRSVFIKNPRENLTSTLEMPIDSHRIVSDLWFAAK